MHNANRDEFLRSKFSRKSTKVVSNDFFQPTSHSSSYVSNKQRKHLTNSSQSFIVVGVAAGEKSSMQSLCDHCCQNPLL